MPDRESRDEIERLIAGGVARDARLADAEARVLAARAETARLRDEVGRLEGEVARLEATLAARKTLAGIELP